MVAVYWKQGVPMEVSMSFTDPLGEKVSRPPSRVNTDNRVSTEKLSTSKPLKPGIWTFELNHGKVDPKIVFKKKYLVLPLTHFGNSSPLQDPKKTNGIWAFVNSHHPNVSPELYEEWKANVTSSGKALYAYIDHLVDKFWKLFEVCIDTEGVDKCPSMVPKCRKTKWSTFSPDPKSELVPVKEDGRIR